MPIKTKNDKKTEVCVFGFSRLAFFGSAVNTLRIVVTAIGAGIGIWGIINLLEGYGQDNSGAKSQGIKQLMAGGGVVIIAQTLIPLLANMFD